jgi:hypothetical protein
MTAYRITYQTRRRAGLSIHQGDWQNRENVVVAGDDARDAIDEIINGLGGYDFRLQSVEVTGQVTAIAHNLIAQARINPTNQESQNTTGKPTRVP